MKFYGELASKISAWDALTTEERDRKINEWWERARVVLLSNRT